ncbi:hypothetical protein BDM02DRAFT_3182100 [Thelephora ganbajun]|uniref:Uncharacterized protein n=1 Tax=Thelephora ganbajun TaxID=370292 RepID=A0ACB6ZXK6_THEGA|nr:hypothetical protein BDM02DRAFT_3182100 [Thelephora ganbajun]
MAPSKSDSRNAPAVATSISTPRKLSPLSQVDRKVFKLPGSAASSQKKRGLSEDCNPNIDNVRQRTDSVSSTTIRAQSKIQAVFQSASSLRRSSSETPRQPVSDDSAKPKVMRRTVSAKSAVQFPKVEASQSSIPTRTASVNNERKRVLSRSDESPQQPRVRQRLTSSTSIDTVRGVEPMDQPPRQERRRLESTTRSRIPNITDPARGDVSRGAVSSANATTQKKTQSSDTRIRKPFGRTQTPAVVQQNNTNAPVLDIGSITEQVLVNDAATLAYRQGVPEEDIVMCIDDLEEIPDLPLSRPSSVAQARAQAAFDAERFDVRIEAPKNTEVWDTIEDGVYAWQGTLCVTDTQSRALYENTPPVDRISLECRSRELPSSPNSSLSKSDSHTQDHQVSYQGQSLHEDEVLRAMDYTKGISVNKRWDRVFSYQDPTRVDWKLKFWVPIPMKLFYKLEEKQFRLRAQLTFKDPSGVSANFTAETGSVDITISSLKTSKYVGSPCSP